MFYFLVLWSKYGPKIVGLKSQSLRKTLKKKIMEFDVI